MSYISDELLEDTEQIKKLLDVVSLQKKVVHAAVEVIGYMSQQVMANLIEKQQLAIDELSVKSTDDRVKLDSAINRLDKASEVIATFKRRLEICENLVDKPRG